MTDVSTISEGGYTVSSNTETPEQVKAILSDGKEPEKPSESEAAAVLGKKGGEAAAAKRSEAAKEAKAEKEAEQEARSEPDKPAAEDEKPLGKPRDDPRARMLEATRKEAEAKREAQRERAERERLAARLAELERGQKPAEAPKAAPSDDAEPQEGDFEDYRDYVKAVARHEYRQAAKEAAKQAHEKAYREGITEAVNSFTKRMDEAEAKDPEYNAKVAHIAVEFCPSFKAKAQGIPLAPIHVITDEIINSEHAPALTLHLAEHPEEFQRLQALRSPLEVQLAMAKLEARMEYESKRSDAAPQATAPKAVPSQAKPPLRPVNGSPHTAETVPGDDASYEAHRSYWTRKDRERTAQR